MTTKYEVAEEFEDLFAFRSAAETTAHEAQMLAYRFINETVQVMESQGVSQADLAQRIGIKFETISQIFRGDKPLTFALLARIERALGVIFTVSTTKQ